MINDARLENYLTALDRTLKPFPVGDRAEIVTEIRSHILAAMEKNPDSNLDEILRALGEPETVANRYLLERGLKPIKPPISPLAKWLVIGFLGTLALALILFGVVITRFAPLVDVGKKGVSLFGGLIHVDSSHSTRFSVHSNEGSFQAGQNQLIEVKFENGNFDFENSPDSRVTWDCKISGETNRNQEGEPSRRPRLTKEGEIISLDFSPAGWAKCEIHVPANAHLKFTGTNGSIQLENPLFNVDGRIENGEVQITPEEYRLVWYDLTVNRGTVDQFTSAIKEKSLKIRIVINNGAIIRND